MTYDIRLAIHLLVPEAQYGGAVVENTKEEFDALRWEDERKKPTWKQVTDTHDQLVPVFNIKQELADLDGVYSRADEDRDAQMGFAPHEDSPQAKAKQRKLELRQQLAELEA